MATKTFSSRVDEDDYAYVNALSHQEFGMSYGQYCGSVLVDTIRQEGKFPRPSHTDEVQRRKNAINELKAFSARPHNKEIGLLSDTEIKDMIASRYE